MMTAATVEFFHDDARPGRGARAQLDELPNCSNSQGTQRRRHTQLTGNGHGARNARRAHRGGCACSCHRHAARGNRIPARRRGPACRTCPRGSSRGCAHGPRSRGLRCAVHVPGRHGPRSTGPRSRCSDDRPGDRRGHGTRSGAARRVAPRSAHEAARRARRTCRSRLAACGRRVHCRSSCVAAERTRCSLAVAGGADECRRCPRESAQAARRRCGAVPQRGALGRAQQQPASGSTRQASVEAHRTGRGAGGRASPL